MEERGNTTGPGVQQPKIPKVSGVAWWIIGLTGVFVGLLIPIYNTRIAFTKLIGLSAFWKSLVSSICCAWLLMLAVIMITHWLDAAVPWRRPRYRRLLAQALLGVGIPGMLALGWQLIFLACLNCIPGISNYFYSKFPLVLVFVASFNVLWIKGLRQQGGVVSNKEWVSGAPTDASPDASRLGTAAGDRIMELADTIAFFVSEDKQTIGYLLDGGTTVEMDTVREIAQALEGDDFFNIRHGVVINRAAIDHVHPEQRHHRIVLKPPYDDRIFYTSKSHSRGFGMWWGKVADA